MTHPLTPREKVIAILDEHTTVGGTSAYRTGQVNSDELAGLILTALASGSGDHAELARLAEAAEHDPEYDGRSFEAAANPATILALIAEKAALRVQVETEKRLSVENYKRASARATEAERKLAEAVGLVERSIDLMTDEYADTKAYREEVRTFLSKEAERG